MEQQDHSLKNKVQALERESRALKKKLDISEKKIQALEAEKRAAETKLSDLTALHVKSTLNEYLIHLEKLLRPSVQVQQDQNRRSSLSHTRVEGNFCPELLKKWSDYANSHAKQFAKISSILGNKRLFYSRSNMEVVRDCLTIRRIGYEDTTTNFADAYLETPVIAIINRYLNLRGGGDSNLTITSNVTENRRPPAQNDRLISIRGFLKVQEKSAELTVKEKEKRSSQAARGRKKTSQTLNLRKKADRYGKAVALNEDNDSGNIIFLGEIKAGHKLSSSTFKKILDDEPVLLFCDYLKYPPTTAPISADKHDKHGEGASSERLGVAMVLCQAYHYMIDQEVYYGYISSGFLTILLKLEKGATNTLLYHVVPGHDFDYTEVEKHQFTASETPAAYLATLSLLALAEKDGIDRKATDFAFPNKWSPAGEESDERLDVKPLRLGQGQKEEEVASEQQKRPRKRPRMHPPGSLSPKGLQLDGSMADNVYTAFPGTELSSSDDDDERSDESSGAYESDESEYDETNPLIFYQPGTTGSNHLQYSNYLRRRTINLEETSVIRPVATYSEDPDFAVEDQNDARIINPGRFYGKEAVDEYVRLRRLNEADRPSAPPVLPTNEYCTHACLLGLFNKGPLDKSCPNFRGHAYWDNSYSSLYLDDDDDDRIAYHTISEEDVMILLRKQLKRNYLENVELLKGQRGRIGHLYKFQLTAYDYTFVGKAVEEEDKTTVIWEWGLYRHCQELQGKIIPVCLGAMHTVHVYRPGIDRRTSYFLLLSYAGKTLFDETPENVDLKREESRSVRELRETCGVDHGDVRKENLTWSTETQRVMLLDLDRAALYGKPKSRYVICEDCEGWEDLTSETVSKNVTKDREETEGRLESQEATEGEVRDVEKNGKRKRDSTP